MLIVGGLAMIAPSLVVVKGLYEVSRSLGEWEVWKASLGRMIVSSACVGAAHKQYWNSSCACANQSSWRCPSCISRGHANPALPFDPLPDQLPRLRGRPWGAVLHPLHTPPVLTAISPPTARLRDGILAFAALFATCVRSLTSDLYARLASERNDYS